MKQLMSNDNGYQTVYDPEKGYGIVLGKYQQVNTTSKTITDFDSKEIAGPESQEYKDAMDLALRSGYGYSALEYDEPFADMKDHIVSEDVPVHLDPYQHAEPAIEPDYHHQDH